VTTILLLVSSAGSCAQAGSGASTSDGGPIVQGDATFPVPPANDAGADDGRDASVLDTIHALCVASPPRPLTAGSYVEPTTGLTVHWPAGWTLTSPPDSPTATLTASYTWTPTGSTTPMAGEVTFAISKVYYGNASQPPQALAQGAAQGSAVTLAGQPAAVWWDLEPVPQPQCPAPCGSFPPLPELLNVEGMVQFTGDGGLGFEIDLGGAARADAQPQQIFCDMEAMILGVTLAR
jgi:hypothetical protein